MCCSSGLAKCFLVIINVVFFVVGAVVLALGILARYFEDVLIQLFAKVPDQLMDDVNQAWDIPALLAEAAVMLIIVGVIIFPIGFFGCCGALKENKCMLGTYVTILLAILCMEVATIIVICVRTQGAEDAVVSSLQRSIENNYLDSTGGLSFDENGNLKFAIRPVKLAWDGIQVAMGCCGAINASDYIKNNFHGNYTFNNLTIDDAMVPLSCCSFINKGEYEDARKDYDPTAPTEGPERGVGAGGKKAKVKVMKTAKNAYQAVQDCLTVLHSEYTNPKGCYGTFMDLIEAYWGIFIGIIVGIIVLEAVAVWCACSVMRRQDNRGDYSKPA